MKCPHCRTKDGLAGASCLPLKVGDLSSTLSSTPPALSSPPSPQLFRFRSHYCPVGYFSPINLYVALLHKESKIYPNYYSPKCYAFPVSTAIGTANIALPESFRMRQNVSLSLFRTFKFIRNICEAFRSRWRSRRPPRHQMQCREVHYGKSSDTSTISRNKTASPPMALIPRHICSGIHANLENVDTNQKKLFAAPRWVRYR